MTVRITGRLVASVIGISALVLMLMLAFTGIHLSFDGYGAMTLLAPLLALGAWRLGHARARLDEHRQLADFCGFVAAFSAVSLIGVLSSYPAAAETTGFSDPQLARVDQMLHFDWIWWYQAVSSSYTLQWLGSAIYAAIYVSPLLILAHYARVEDRHSAHQFILTFWLAALLTLMLFPLFPAEGPLAFLWHGPIPYMPTSALYQEQLIPALRAHQVTHIDLGALRGLVCAPSFHSAAAVIYIATAWRIPRLRWPIGLLNLAMLAATPVEGTHYLTDMIVGGLVAICALLTISGLARIGQGELRAARR